MKRSTFLLTLLGGAVFAGAPAVASDYGVPPEFRPSTFDVYVGAYGGATMLSSRYSEANETGSRSLDGTTFSWGVRMGADYLMGDWVLGAVADVTFGGEIAEDSDFDSTLEMPLMGTVRARAGRKWAHSLLYVTGGFAQAEMKLATDYAGSSDDDSGWAKGWALGAGFDYALTDSVTMGLEYLFIGLNDMSYAHTDSLAAPYDYDQDIQGIHTIRLGIDYRFHI